MATEQERALADLLVSVMNAREEEGARVSRVLHDDVGQVLSAIGLQLDLLRMDIAENVEDCSRRITEIQKVLEFAVTQVRDLSYELNPSIVERAGLQFALDRLVGRYRKDARVPIRLLFDPSVRLPLDAGTVVYKIAEEALDNAVRHSGGSKIEVLVRPAKQGVCLEVRDDGKGFDASREGPATKGLGLHLMQYHANQAGLRFSIASSKEKGTIVKAICRVTNAG